MIHELKIHTIHLHALKFGQKKCEVRMNDRNYQVGDYLHLREWFSTNDGEYGEYGDDECMVRVMHVLADQTYLQPGYVILSTSDPI
jgi:ASC-1-like (ASCH) protein